MHLSTKKDIKKNLKGVRRVRLPLGAPGAPPAALQVSPLNPQPAPENVQETQKPPKSFSEARSGPRNQVLWEDREN